MLEFEITIKVKGIDALFAKLLAALPGIQPAMVETAPAAPTKAPHMPPVEQIAQPAEQVPDPQPSIPPPVAALPVVETAKQVQRPDRALRGAFKWSDERITLLLKLRAEGYHDDDIITALNLLAGAELGALAIRDRIAYEREAVKNGKTGLRLAHLAGVQNKVPRRIISISAKQPEPVIAKPPIISPRQTPSTPAIFRKVTTNPVDMMLARDAANAVDAPIDWAALLNWARVNSVDIEALDSNAAIAKVNATRHVHGLVPWRLVASRGKLEELSHPSIGGGNPDDYSKPKRGAVRA